MRSTDSSTWASIRLGMYTAVMVAFVVGIGLIQQDNSPNFLNLYFTKAVPISLTTGGLVFCIAEIFRHRKD